MRSVKLDVMAARYICCFCLLLVSLDVCAEEAGAISSAGREQGERFFESKVRPILARRCYQCHSLAAKKAKGELVLDDAERFRAGSARGPVVVANKPDESLLIQAIRQTDEELKMPPSRKLPATEIRVLVRWVQMGAVVPNQPNSEPVGNPRDFWSFQTPLRFDLPQVERTAWPRARIDSFVLRALESRRLSPSDPADRRTLIRRVTFDLIGLPPTEDEVQAFINDASPRAYEQVIDRLLASPHYGERWARHWLDLARYTDVTASWLKGTGQAWHYRDWVVRAINDDRPYDDFVKQQIAADLIPDHDPRDLAALGFIGLSPTYWKEPRLAPDVIKVVVAEEWEERIDAFSRTFLGLTVACARCHDHKFDPITMQDYYALAGVFANTKLGDRPMLAAAEAASVVSAHAQVAALLAEIEKIQKSDAAKAAELTKQVEQIRKSTPNFNAPMVHAVEEASIHVLPDGPDATRVEYRTGEMLDLPVFLRGDPTTPGEVARRRFIAILSDAEPPAFKQGSGRLELAESLFREGLPLTARVIVNRVWRHHFGRGLVATPSNFGLQGERPSHPDLLDDLTARFIETGWSLKSLHREILLSSTYRQSSNFDQKASQIDPENHFLWRMNRRRLDIESWRDATLAATGELNLRIGGAAFELKTPTSRRRTLYGKIGRRDPNGMLMLYDFPPATAHSPARAVTTTPLQQLFVLNSPFFEARTRALAEFSSGSTTEKVQQLYHRLWQRDPSENELMLANEFLGENSAAAGVWPQYVQVLLGSNEFMFVD